MFTLVGSEGLFQGNQHAVELRSVLTEVDLHFFDTPGLFTTWMESTKERHRYIVFTQEEWELPEHNEQITVISFTEENTHLNDLIYRILQEKNKIRTNGALMDRITNIVRPSSKSVF